MIQTQISLDSARLARLDAIASARSTTREAVIDLAIDAFLEQEAADAEYDRWFRRKVEAGLQAIREGKVYTAEEVREHSKALLAKLNRQRELQ